MRNQQAPILKVNGFYPEIEPLCRGGAYQEKSGGSQAPSMCVAAAEQGSELAPTCQLECGKFKESPKEKVLLCQPVFVLDKERPIKRPAVDLTLNPQQNNNESEKRVRSSSFSFLSSFPPSPSDLRKNVFTPSSLLQDHSVIVTSSPGKSQTWAVIKPATLQAPEISLCPEGQNAECESAPSQMDSKMQPQDRNKSALDNGSKIKFAPACILGNKTNRNQPFVPGFGADKITSDFVFGENMEKRVMSPRRSLRSQSSTAQGKWEAASPRSVASHRSWPYPRKACTSLIESAAAYTSKSRVKYELDQLEIITGEESERNVLQVNCRLFVLNKDTLTWTERGRGNLRLNDLAASDNGMFRSRIVMRNHGTLKLLLNSRIFEQMKLERASRKSLHITATDLMDHSLKFFLVQASVKDAGRLFAAIHHRLVALRNCRQRKADTAPTEVPTEAKTHSLLVNSDSEDEDEMTSIHSSLSEHDQWIRRQPVLYS
uniref:RAN binding protein 3-like n=1 Tax=Xenopus tropicalis TaxID=8364 RepID=A0A803K4G3_XENTR|eukprot:XP_017946309.1 PREDICTED: ran-binding protein 3-like isoform X2 [Xenopus tropicalis]